MNVADPEIYIFSGMTPIEAEIHLKALTLFGNITRDENTTVEWRIAERQFHIKTNQSHSWFIEKKSFALIITITYKTVRNIYMLRSVNLHGKL